MPMTLILSSANVSALLFTLWTIQGWVVGLQGRFLWRGESIVLLKVKFSLFLPEPKGHISPWCYRCLFQIALVLLLPKEDSKRSWRTTWPWMSSVALSSPSMAGTQMKDWVWVGVFECLAWSESMIAPFWTNPFPSLKTSSPIFFFLGPHLQRMEIPRLGIESVLQLPIYTTATATRDLSPICDLHWSLQQCQILSLLSEARVRTYILMDTSQILKLLSHSGNSKGVIFFLSPTCSIWEWPNGHMWPWSLLGPAAMLLLAEWKRSWKTGGGRSSCCGTVG